jgi:adenine-specific DNA-methyltransferase
MGGRQLGFEEQTQVLEWQQRLLEAFTFELSRDPSVATVESSRLETLYEEYAPYGFRKVRGQFFTPPPIALFMVEWALAKSPGVLLDPGLGTGVFLRAAISVSQKLGITQPTMVGYETDRTLLQICKDVINALGAGDAHLLEQDFLTTEINDRFDAVVANPPYIRHHEMEYTEDIFQWFDKECGFRVSRLTNAYGLFMLKIHLLLSAKGRAAVLTPSEFLNADFGVSIKRYLVETGALDTLVIFDNMQLVFEGVLTTACVTMLDAERDRDKPLRIVHVRDAQALGEVKEAISDGVQDASGDGWLQILVEKDDLDAQTKWTSIGIAPKLMSSRLVPLNSIARVMRGIATGANSFFTLTQEEVDLHGIEGTYLRPCITKANHAPHSDFKKEDFDVLKTGGKKCYLLYYAGGPVSENLQKYLDFGVQQGVHERYLTRHRQPWFLTEERDPAPVWVTVFGRKGLRFVSNRPRIWNLTAFHCVYPEFEDENLIKALMAYLVSKHAASMVLAQWRVYGDGLVKMEPKDVGRIPVLDVREMAQSRVSELASLFDQLCVEQRMADRGRLTAILANISYLVERGL